MALFQNTIDYNEWVPWCAVDDIAGTWQISPSSRDNQKFI